MFRGLCSLSGLVAVMQSGLSLCFLVPQFAPMTQDRCSPKTVVRGHDERDPQKPWQEYQRALERKKYEVQRMMEAHQDKYDPVVMRLNYYQSDPNPKVILSLRKAIDQEDPQRLALVGDLKRKTPSGSPTDREVLSFVDPGDVALKMAELGFDAVFVNCDGPSYGGSYRDLDIVSKRLKKAFDFNQRPAIIAKDIFIHPVQVAMAAEMGADGVILNAGVLGQDLSGMMEACGVMGLEAVVECHSYMDVEMAKQNVATTVLINNWDRQEGLLHPKRAIEGKTILPPEIITMACGCIRSEEQIEELASAGFDGVVLGKKLREDDVPSLVGHFKTWVGPNRFLSRLGVTQSILNSYEKSPPPPAKEQGFPASEKKERGSVDPKEREKESALSEASRRQMEEEVGSFSSRGRSGLSRMKRFSMPPLEKMGGAFEAEDDEREEAGEEEEAGGGDTENGEAMGRRSARLDVSEQTLSFEERHNDEFSSTPSVSAAAEDSPPSPSLESSLSDSSPAAEIPQWVRDMEEREKESQAEKAAAAAAAADEDSPPSSPDASLPSSNVTGRPTAHTPDEPAMHAPPLPAPQTPNTSETPSESPPPIQSVRSLPHRRGRIFPRPCSSTLRTHLFCTPLRFRMPDGSQAASILRPTEWETERFLESYKNDLDPLSWKVPETLEELENLEIRKTNRDMKASLEKAAPKWYKSLMRSDFAKKAGLEVPPALEPAPLKLKSPPPPERRQKQQQQRSRKAHTGVLPPPTPAEMERAQRLEGIERETGVPRTFFKSPGAFSSLAADSQEKDGTEAAARAGLDAESLQEIRKLMKQSAQRNRAAERKLAIPTWEAERDDLRSLQEEQGAPVPTAEEEQEAKEVEEFVRQSKEKQAKGGGSVREALRSFVDLEFSSPSEETGNATDTEAAREEVLRIVEMVEDVPFADFSLNPENDTATAEAADEGEKQKAGLELEAFDPFIPASKNVSVNRTEVQGAVEQEREERSEVSAEEYAIREREAEQRGSLASSVLFSNSTAVNMTTEEYVRAALHEAGMTMMKRSMRQSFKNAQEKRRRDAASWPHSSDDALEGSLTKNKRGGKHFPINTGFITDEMRAETQDPRDPSRTLAEVVPAPRDENGNLLLPFHPVYDGGFQPNPPDKYFFRKLVNLTALEGLPKTKEAAALESLSVLPNSLRTAKMTPAKIQTALKEVADLSALVKEDEAEEEEERRKRGEVATKESLQSRNLVSPLFSEDEEKKRARAEDDEPNFQAVPLEQPVDDRVKRELLRIRGLLPPRGSRLNVTDDEYIRQNLPALMQTPDFVDLVREDASEVPESLTPELSKVFLKFAKKYKKLTPTEKEALFKDHATRFPLSIQRDEKGLRQPVDYDMTQMSLEERDAYERYKREGMAAERMYNRTQDDMARMNDIAETFGKRSRLVPDPIETDPLTGLPKTPTRGPFAGTEWEPESHRVGEMHRPLTPVRPVPKHMKDQFEQLALEQKFGEDDLALWREGKQETADRELIETLIGDSAENEGGGRENGEDMDVAQIGNMLAAAGGGKGAVSAKDVRAWVQKQKMSGLLRGFAGGEGKEGEEEQTKRISSSVGGVDDESDFLYATPDGDMMTQEELMQKMMQKEREASETAIEWKVGEAAAKARSVTGAAAVDWEGGPQSSNIFDISEFYSGQQQPPSPHSLQEAAAFADIEEVERYLKDQEVQRGRNPVSGSQENPSWYEQPGGGVGGELSRREDGDLDDDDIDPARMSEFRGEMGEDGEEWEPPGSGERKGSSGWSSTGKEPRMRGLR